MKDITEIYYLPEKGSVGYVMPGRQEGVLMNTLVVDTEGLVRYCEGLLGWYVEKESFNSRLSKYYHVAEHWITDHPENILHKSFNPDTADDERVSHKLSIARQMLLWRDALKMAQWNFECADINSRLGALAAIEKQQCVAGIPDRIQHLCEFLTTENSTDEFANKKIKLQADRADYQPIIKRLLACVEKHGATVEQIPYPVAASNNLDFIRKALLNQIQSDDVFDITDDSLEVWKFDNGCDLAEYMAIVQPELVADVWVAPKAKELDNRLTALRRPTVGSAVTSRSRILNLLPLTISLYDKELNISKIVEWLSAPVHPLPYTFRYTLAAVIARTGGFLNKECQEIKEKFVDGEYDMASSKSTREDRQTQLRLYLPYLDSSDLTDKNAEETLNALYKWTSNEIHYLKERSKENTFAKTQQLSALKQHIAVLLSLFSEPTKTFSLVLAREWVQEIPEEFAISHHEAEIGCEFTVTSPAYIASEARTLVWTGMEHSEPEPFDCDFLFPSERELIENHAQFWDRNAESRFRYQLSILPFLFTTKKLIVAYAKNDGGEKLVQPPAITRIASQIPNFKNFEKTPSIKELMKTESPKCHNVELESKDEHLFENSENVKFPAVMSATSLEKLIQYPFDFMFNYILGFKRAGLASLPNIDMTKGKVAHSVIQRLLDPNIASDKTAFDDAFNDAVYECGAILLLPENNIEKDSLKERLKTNVDILQKIIDDNNLEVVGCETKHTSHVDFDQADDDDNLEGIIDMILRDRGGNLLVFDFKWTSNPYKFEESIEENRALQLAVYAELLKKQSPKVLTAYFAMPIGKLFVSSGSGLIGENVVDVTPNNNDDLTTLIVEAYNSRLEEFQKGRLEEGEGWIVKSTLEKEPSFESRCYSLLHKDVKTGKLNEKLKKELGIDDEFEVTETKKENKYSDYKLFKGAKK